MRATPASPRRARCGRRARADRRPGPRSIRRSGSTAPAPSGSAITSPSRRASAGASPSNGSSSRSRRVPAISARASATIFCWPPDSSSERRPRNASISGMIEKIHFSRSSLLGDLGRPGRQQDVLLDREARHQPAVLRHVADAVADAAVRRQRQQVDAAELGLAGRRDRAHQRAQQRGLAGAVAADQPAHLALVEHQRGAADDRHRPDRDVEVATLSMRRLDARPAGAADQRLHAASPSATSGVPSAITVPS